jgi:predicted DNA-binding protein
MNDQNLPGGLLGGGDPTPEDLQTFMQDLTFGETLPDSILPDEAAEVMVVRSLRLPPDLDERIREIAAERGLKWSVLVRQWIEQEVAALDDDVPISRADALRALASLRPIGRSPAA